MGRKIIIGISLVLAVVCFCFIMRSVPDQPASAMAAPDFTWQSLDGTKHTLKEYSGHPVVLHFWASWCGPCREELPKLFTAASRNKNIIFLAISSDEDAKKSQAFIKQAQTVAKVGNLPNMLFALDPDKNITFNIFQTTQYPESIFLDAGHNLRSKSAGAVDWESEDSQNMLNHL